MDKSSWVAWYRDHSGVEQLDVFETETSATAFAHEDCAYMQALLEEQGYKDVKVTSNQFNDYFLVEAQDGNIYSEWYIIPATYHAI